MIAERLPRVFEPGENAGVALIEHPVGRADLQPGDDLFDQLSFAVAGQRRDDFLVVQKPRGNERLLAAVAVCARSA